MVFLLSVVVSAASIVVVCLAADTVKNAYKLKHISGPLWCRFTNLVRASWVQRGFSHLKHQALHERYGDIALCGPSAIIVSDPAMIPVIYPMRPGFPKGKFYATLMPYTSSGSALPLVFNCRDEGLHSVLKSPIAPIFSLTSILKFEHYISQVTDLLLHQLDERFADVGSHCNLGDWLQYYAFEVMATLTFSSRYGFLEHGNDENGLIAAIWSFMKTAAPVSDFVQISWTSSVPRLICEKMTQIPWLDKILYKNQLVAWLRPTTGMPILNLARERISHRRAAMTDGSVTKEDSIQKDMLDHFLAVQAANPATPEWAPVAWTFSNLIAGSDSTAVVMRTLWHNLVSFPESAKKLYDELVQAEISENSPWNQLSPLRFLDACFNEAVRLHPPFCLPFERVVPPTGVWVCGKFLPGGTIVGMNPWVVNRHTGTFGADADQWRPERWMCAAAERKAMDQAILTFGAGKRICLGRHIAAVEVKKVTCALLLRYEMEIADVESFKTENFWFFRQTGLNIKMRHRKSV